MTQLTHLNTLTVPASLARSNHEIFQRLQLEKITLHCMGIIKKRNLENLLNTQSNLQSLSLWHDDNKQNIIPFVELLSSKQFARLELRNWIISGREQLKQLLGGLKKLEGSTELPSLTINRIDLRFTVPDEEMNNLKELRLEF
jgi:hypothetical protein